MYPKFKEIALDTATWTVAFLGAIEERETKSKKPFCTFHLLDGDIAITANLWNTEKKDIYKVQEKSVISVQLYGAITMPAVKEAMLLHEIDVIDASMYQYEQVEKTLNPGEMSDRIFGLGVKVYKPAANAEEKANV